MKKDDLVELAEKYGISTTGKTRANILEQLLNYKRNPPAKEEAEAADLDEEEEAEDADLDEEEEAETTDVDEEEEAETVDVDEEEEAEEAKEDETDDEEETIYTDEERADVPITSKVEAEDGNEIPIVEPIPIVEATLSNGRKIIGSRTAVEAAVRSDTHQPMTPEPTIPVQIPTPPIQPTPVSSVNATLNNIISGKKTLTETRAAVAACFGL
jgi:hypothetical protein